MPSNFLVRASQLSRLMTEPKLKSDKDSGALSETAKSLVTEIWMKDSFGYKENVVTDEMMKGLVCEQDSIALVQDILGGEFRIKNTTHFSNDYVQGTPDIIRNSEDFCEDVKTSYTLRTFLEAEHKKGSAYWWQGQAYMWLTGKTQYRLMYCLVETPEDILNEQKKRFYFKFGCDEGNKNYQEIAEQIDRNNSAINNIKKESRLKIFEFPKDDECIEKIKIQHSKALNFYLTLRI